MDFCEEKKCHVVLLHINLPHIHIIFKVLEYIGGQELTSVGTHPGEAAFMSLPHWGAGFSAIWLSKITYPCSY